jgi:hypothetical protein
MSLNNTMGSRRAVAASLHGFGKNLDGELVPLVASAGVVVVSTTASQME